MSTAVELVDTIKDYGTVRAVDGLSLAVPEGSLFGLIGPNGAGKTTTFSLLCGFLRPTAGEIRVRGRTLTAGTPPVGHILAMPQDAQLPPMMGVTQVLIYLGRLAGQSKAEAAQRAERALAKVGLAELAGRRVQALSHGQRRRVAIAQTLLGDNEVIILDEPTAGLDPRTAAELRELIKDLHEDRTIILSTHNLSEVEQLCTHAAIIDHGRLVTSGTMEEIREAGALVAVRLGEALSDLDAGQKQLSAIEGVQSVKIDGVNIEIQLDQPESADAVSNEVLKALLALGANVKGVERGKSLEQRFMEETTGRQGGDSKSAN